MSIDFNPSASLRADKVEAIRAAIDAGTRKRSGAGKPRQYLGASSLGHICERNVQLGYIRARRLPGAPEPIGGGVPEPGTQRIFDMGHTVEDLALKWLKDAGFVVRTVDRETGGQYGFMVANDRFGGHCDGIIVSGPAEGVNFPLLFEHKALGRKSWQDVAKKGVAVAKPVYAAQVALYQSYLDLPNPALFMATNRDTAELYLELVEFDGDLAQRTSDRAVRVLTATDAGELLPRAFNSGDNFNCKFCDWRNYCWGDVA